MRATFPSATSRPRPNDDRTGLGAQNECDETNSRLSAPFANACATTATALNFGSGWPGTNSIPGLTTSAAPQLGANFDLLIENSRGQATLVCLLVGSASQAMATPIGGTVLVVPDSEPLYNLPADTTALKVEVPCDLAPCGTTVFLQTISYDPGAAGNYSFSAGWELLIGE